MTTIKQIHQKYKVKNTTPSQRVPRFWLMTDPVKLPDPTSVLASLPSRAPMGLVIRASDPAQEAHQIKIAHRAVLGHKIIGYLVRLSWWHTHTGFPRLYGQLGWHITHESPQVHLQKHPLYSFNWHLLTETLSQSTTRPRQRHNPLCFLSPIDTTTSHADSSRHIGPLRALYLKRHLMGKYTTIALGGITPANAGTLAKAFDGIAAIDLWKNFTFKRRLPHQV